MTADRPATEPRTAASRLRLRIREWYDDGLLVYEDYAQADKDAEVLAEAAQGAAPRAEVVLAHCPHCNGDGCDVCYETGQTEVAAPQAEGLDVERLAEWFHNKWESQGLACWHKNQHMRSWDCGRDAIEATEYASRLYDGRVPEEQD